MGPLSRSLAPWGAVLLFGLVALGILPSAFAQSGGTAAEAAAIGGEGRFSGTAGPGQSRWYRLAYAGNNQSATITLEYQPPNADQTNLEVYTGSPDNLRREETPVVRQDNVLSTTFTDPNPRDVFIRVVNGHTDRTISFVGTVSPAAAVAAPPAGTATPTPGPLADAPQNAVTVGAEGRFQGTIGPRRAVWHRFYYGNPGAEATVSASFSPTADGADLDVYTGADVNNLALQAGEPRRTGDTLVRTVNLSTAQWVYFTVANNTDAQTLANAGEVQPAFAPPATPTAVATTPATAVPTTPPTAVPSPVASPTPGLIETAPPMPRDERYFFETRFRVERDDIWEYFQARGRLETFGYPVSRTFTLDGCQVQIFQRLIAQVCPGRPGVATVNLLDPDIFPYTRVNFSTFPAPSEDLKARTPNVGEANYAERILAFVREVSPNTFEGVPVAFQQTFFSLITPEMGGTSDPGLLGLLNLEIWGAPISAPMRDPNNANFIYQRFQRGIMHHIVNEGITRGILLADYLKQILRNSPELPPDLREQAAAAAATGQPAGRFFAQYCPGAPNWICRSTDLSPQLNNLTFAFEQG